MLEAFVRWLLRRCSKRKRSQRGLLLVSLSLFVAAPAAAQMPGLDLCHTCRTEQCELLYCDIEHGQRADLRPWYCVYGYSHCGPDGSIIRPHSVEHCMMRPQDCRYLPNGGMYPRFPGAQ